MNHNARRPMIPTYSQPSQTQPSQAMTQPPNSASPPNPTTNVAQRPPELPRPIQLCPKPKPGRKPSKDVPLDKRKASNREAQRKFRERRRQKLQEALDELDSERAKRKQIEQEVARDLQRRSGQPSDGHHPPILPNKDAPRRPPSLTMPPVTPGGWNYGMPTPGSSHSSEGANLASPDESASNAYHRMLPPPATSDQTVPMKAENDPIEVVKAQRRSAQFVRQIIAAAEPLNAVTTVMPGPMEVDFTNYGRAIEPQPEPSFAAPPAAHEVDDTCGFCTGQSYCICKAMKEEQDPTIVAAPDADARSVVTAAKADALSPQDPRQQQQALPPNTSQPQPQPAPLLMEPQTSASGPGNCDLCQKDPIRRAMCMEIAQRSSHVQRSAQPPTSTQQQPSAPSQQSGPATATGGDQVRLPSIQPYIQCREAIDMYLKRDRHLVKDPHWPQIAATLRTTAAATCNCNDCGKTGPHSHQDVEVASILESLKQVPSSSKHNSA